MNLLIDTKWAVTPLASGEAQVPPATDKEPEKIAVVKLLTAARLPARQGQMVHARVDDFVDEGAVTLFEAGGHLEKEGVVVETALTQPKPDGSLTLVVHNVSLSPVCLSEGETLGALQPVTVLPDADSTLTPKDVVE